MLVAASRPGIISFALGMPAVELFPTAALAGSRACAVCERGCAAIQPAASVLEATRAELMKRRGVNCREEQIFLTAGAQQGMSLLSRLLEPGGSVITEELIYTGFQQVLEPFQPQVLTVSDRRGDGDGR